MKISRFSRILVMLALVAGAFPMRAFAVDPRAKPLLEEALHLYSERQYVRALDLFKSLREDSGIVLRQPVSKQWSWNPNGQARAAVGDEGSRPEPRVEAVPIDFRLDARQNLVPNT